MKQTCRGTQPMGIEITDKYWRIRMQPGDENDAGEAWAQNKVGIWYGGWTSENLAKALRLPDKKRRLAYLDNLPRQKRLRDEEGWDNLSPAFLDTAIRFCTQIGQSDWVFVCFDDALHLARAGRRVHCSEDSDFNRGLNLFKFRVIKQKKRFRLTLLPDCFRLLPSAGRSNVHEVLQSRGLVKLLAESKDEQEVILALNSMPLAQMLDVMGPNSWESLCEAYLIVTRGFLPTGLSIGKTLATFDIVGRAEGGRKILAQCKKDPTGVHISHEFKSAVDRSADFYFFTYGRCLESPPPGVTVIQRTHIQDWLEQDAKGKQYLTFLREP